MRRTGGWIAGPDSRRYSIGADRRSVNRRADNRLNEADGFADGPSAAGEDRLTGARQRLRDEECTREGAVATMPTMRSRPATSA